MIVNLVLGGFAFFYALLLQAPGEPILKRFEPTLVNFLMLSFLLFVVGIAGVLSRRSILIILMSIELMLNAVNLNLIAFSRYLQLNQADLVKKGLAVNPTTGSVFTIFIIIVAAAEVAVGLGILLTILRNRKTATDEIDLLKV